MVIDEDNAEAMAEIFKDVIRIDSQCCLRMRITCRLVKHSLALEHFTLTIDRGTKPSGKWPDVLVLDRPYGYNVELETCTVVALRVGYTSVPLADPTYSLLARRTYTIPLTPSADDSEAEDGYHLPGFVEKLELASGELDGRTGHPFKLIFLIDEERLSLNPFSFARLLVQRWPLHYEVEIHPYYYRPQPDFFLWKPHVLDTRYQLIRSLSGNPGKGYKLREKEQEQGEAEKEQTE